MECLKILTKNMQNVIVSEYEIQNKIVFSIDSIEYFRGKYNPKNIFLALGADNFINLHKWHRFNELMKITKLIVVQRNNIKIPDHINKINLNINCSSSEIKLNLLKDKDLESKIPTEILHIINAEISLKKGLV